MRIGKHGRRIWPRPEYGRGSAIKASYKCRGLCHSSIPAESFARKSHKGNIMKLSNLLASLLALAAAAPALACAPGHMEIIRTSQIKPTGSFAGFAKAVADHAKW